VSLSETRAAFKTALDTVAGVTGYVQPPTASRSGDAWPRWGGGEKDPSTGLINHTWRVIIYLPQDQATADKWIDDHLDALRRALRAVAYVEAVAPVQLGGTDNSPVYGLMITTSTE
jgi:hypothetical protein